MLSELIWADRPDVVILFETLVHGKKFKEIRVKIQFDGCFSIDRVGHSGGIGILWKMAARVTFVITLKTI